MRVSTLSMRANFLNSLGGLQSKLAQTQLQVATGRRFQTAAEDPVAATRELELTRSVASNKQYSDNANLAGNRLALAEGALVSVGDVLQRLRELSVQAANATETNETRGAIATEVRQQLNSLIQMANTQDGNAQYLFSGFSTKTQPFSQNATGVQYNGDQGQRLVQIGPERQIADSDSGARLFQLIRDGNGTFAVAATAGNTGSGIVGGRTVLNSAQYDQGTYTLNFTSPTAYEVRDAGNVLVTSGAYVAGQAISFRGVQIDISGAPAVGDSFTVSPSRNQDMFAMVQEFADTLDIQVTDDVSRAQFQNRINNVFGNLDQAIGNVLDVRADLGGRMRAVDDQIDTNADVDVQLKSALSDVRDLDYAEALTRLNQQLYGLQAAQKSYTLMQGMSLFDYL